MLTADSSRIPNEETALNELVRVQTVSRRRFLEMAGSAGTGVAATSIFIACGGSSNSGIVTSNPEAIAGTTPARAVTNNRPRMPGANASTCSASAYGTTVASGPVPKARRHLRSDNSGNRIPLICIEQSRQPRGKWAGSAGSRSRMGSDCQRRTSARTHGMVEYNVPRICHFYYCARR